MAMFFDLSRYGVVFSQYSIMERYLYLFVPHREAQTQAGVPRTVIQDGIMTDTMALQTVTKMPLDMPQILLCIRELKRATQNLDR